MDMSLVTIVNENTDESFSSYNISDENLDTIALDVDMMSVLKNTRLKGDEKWYQYYKALERYLYKRDPTFKPFQFTFDIQEDNSGNLTYIIKPGRRVKSTRARALKLLSFTPSLIGPLIGAAVTFLLR
jgi:hypothetical protein